MRNTILSLFVASGLLLVGPAADADSGGSGRCTAISVSALGAVYQIGQGINMVNNCNAVLAEGIAFVEAGCENVDTNVRHILQNGESCNAFAAVCDALFSCFGAAPDFCVLVVPECTFP